MLNATYPIDPPTHIEPGTGFAADPAPGAEDAAGAGIALSGDGSREHGSEEAGHPGDPAGQPGRFADRVESTSALSGLQHREFLEIRWRQIQARKIRPDRQQAPVIPTDPHRRRRFEGDLDATGVSAALPATIPAPPGPDVDSAGLDSPPPDRAKVGDPAPGLLALAEAIRNEAIALVLDGVERHCRIGELLIEARAACGHGRWGLFLEVCGIGERFARDCMRFARNRDRIEDLRRDLEANRHGRADLTIEEVRRHLVDPDRRRAPSATDEGPSGRPGHADVRSIDPAGPIPTRETSSPADDTDEMPAEEIGEVSGTQDRADGAAVPPAVEPVDDRPATSSDEGWLASLPVRGQLAGPARAEFDAEALAWRRDRPLLAALRERNAPADPGPRGSP